MAASLLANQTSVVTVSTANGVFIGAVALVAVVDPVNVPGLSLSLSPAQVTLTSKIGSATSTLTIGTTSQTPPGTYDIVVIGISGPVFTAATVEVTVI